jgi:D-glycero-D-manno-heptose 1,7-bisphosphate phosphatase
VSNKAVIFDRDGVLNELVPRGDTHTAPWTISEFKFLPNAKDAVKLVDYYGYKTYVVTNQPDVHDGLMSQSTLDTMTKMIESWLGIEEVVCCQDRKDPSYKPGSDAFEYLIKMYDIDRDRSYLIGDRWKDIVAGHRSGLKTIFVGSIYTYPDEYKDIQPDYIVDNVLQACMLIVENEND